MSAPEIDPTFYRSAAEAAAAPAEELAYVAALARDGTAGDAMSVVDVNPASGDYGRVVGWTDMPGAATRSTTSGGTPAAARSSTRAMTRAAWSPALPARARDPLLRHPRAGHLARSAQARPGEDARRGGALG